MITRGSVSSSDTQSFKHRSILLLSPLVACQILRQTTLIDARSCFSLPTARAFHLHLAPLLHRHSHRQYKYSQYVLVSPIHHTIYPFTTAFTDTMRALQLALLLAYPLLSLSAVIVDPESPVSATTNNTVGRVCREIQRQVSPGTQVFYPGEHDFLSVTILPTNILFVRERFVSLG